MNGKFCPLCGTLLRKDEPCRGCARGIKRVEEAESLEDRLYSAFKNDKRVERFLPRLREYHVDLLNSPRCLRGKLYELDEKPLADVIMDVNAIAPLKRFTNSKGRKYFEVPESLFLSGVYRQEAGKPEKTYLLAIRPGDYWAYKKLSVRCAHTPSKNPLGQYIVHFNLGQGDNCG